MRRLVERQRESFDERLLHRLAIEVRGGGSGL
jgi:hypothetical protein